MLGPEAFKANEALLKLEELDVSKKGRGIFRLLDVVSGWFWTAERSEGGLILMTERSPS